MLVAEAVDAFALLRRDLVLAALASAYLAARAGPALKLEEEALAVQHHAGEGNHLS